MNLSPAKDSVTLLIVSDIHFAGATEQARGSDYELVAIRKPFTRALARAYRHHIWMRDPFARSPQFERFLATAPVPDLTVVNGDYTADTAFIGLGDPAARASAAECLEKLAKKFGPNLHLVIGDHETGKQTMFSGSGGMRLASWRATMELGLTPFWRVDVGNYVLLAVASPLLALASNRGDTLPDEWPEWERLRAAHLEAVRAGFAAVPSDRLILFFCHDPTALPYLAQEETVRSRLGQIEHTIIGHLHSNLILTKSRLLSGVPPIGFLGRNVKKFTAALSKARSWKPFKIKLCPALAGIELLNDGGYFTVQLDLTGKRKAEFTFHPLPREHAP